MNNFATHYLPKNPLTKSSKTAYPVRGTLTNPTSLLIETNVTNQYANLITVDCDYKTDNWDWTIKEQLYDNQLGIPEPNYIVENPASGHAQLGWFIDGFIKTTNPKQHHLFQIIQTFLTEQLQPLNSDKAYNHLFTRNPLNVNHKTIWLHDTLIKMNEMLGLYPDMGKVHNQLKERKETEIGLGRNVDTFNELRLIAYKTYTKVLYNKLTVEAWLEQLTDYAFLINISHAQPMPTSEVMAIVTSIHKFCVTKFSREEFSKKQKFRSAKAIEARNLKSAYSLQQIITLVEGGLTWKQACEQLDLNYNYWRRYKNTTS